VRTQIITISKFHGWWFDIGNVYLVEELDALVTADAHIVGQCSCSKCLAATWGRPLYAVWVVVDSMDPKAIGGVIPKICCRET